VIVQEYMYFSFFGDNLWGSFSIHLTFTCLKFSGKFYENENIVHN